MGVQGFEGLNFLAGKMAHAIDGSHTALAQHLENSIICAYHGCRLRASLDLSYHPSMGYTRKSVSGKTGASSRAITLAEVMLAVGLLGLILLSVMGLFHSLLASTSKSNDMTVATVMAQQRLNELVTQQPAYKSAYGQDFPNDVLTQAVYAHDSQSSSTFYSKARPELLKDEPNFGRTYYLEVEVYWNTADPNQVAANRHQQGAQSVKAGRVVYVPTS